MLMSDRITISFGSISPDSWSSASSPEAAKCMHIRPLRASRRKRWRNSSGDVGLVVDHQDADGHADLPLPVACRGRRTVNSVNSPSSLSTAIVPPCCCVTMS